MSEHRGSRGRAIGERNKKSTARLELVAAGLGMALAFVGIQKAFDSTLAERAAREGRPSDSMLFYQFINPMTPEIVEEFKQGAPGTSDRASWDVGLGFGYGFAGSAYAAAALARRRRKLFGTPENSSKTS
jgi:hypothetical protein